MDNLKDKILMLFVSISLFGCISHDVKEAEKMVGFAVSKQIKYETKTEYWNDFNGEGFKIIVYKIKNLDYFIQHIKTDKFNEFDFNDTNNPFAKSEIAAFITNGKGYYITLSKEQVYYKAVVIDLFNKQLIYYYVSM
jgi:hypothetical protein